MTYYRISHPAFGSYTYEVGEDENPYDATERIKAAAREAYPDASGDVTLEVLSDMTAEEYGALWASNDPLTLALIKADRS